MRHCHCTIAPSDVRALARETLEKVLPWRGYGLLVTAGKLLDLLLLAACLRSSLSAVVKFFRFGFSHETARKAVRSNLAGTTEAALVEGAARALFAFLPRRLRRKARWVAAIDEHRAPFYGDRSAPGVTGGQKKHGSHHAFAYATAVLVHKRHRFAVGVIPLDGSKKPHEVVKALLDLIRRHRLKLRGVVLDAGFDSGDTIRLLQARRLSYAVPLRKKGNAANRRNAAWGLEPGTVTTVAWTTEKSRRRVATRAVVWRRSGGEVRVVAFGGWGQAEAARQAGRASLAKRWYRKRFGIETSYRQMNQAKGLTTAKGPLYRLLLVVIALLVRQVWVHLTALVARALRLRPSAHVAALPLRRLTGWLADFLKSLYPEDFRILASEPQP